jgi:hypothetical protein
LVSVQYVKTTLRPRLLARRSAQELAQIINLMDALRASVANAEAKPEKKMAPSRGTKMETVWRWRQAFGVPRYCSRKLRVSLVESACNRCQNHHLLHHRHCISPLRTLWRD